MKVYATYLSPEDQDEALLAEIRADLMREGLIVENVELERLCLCDECLRVRYLEVV